MILLIEIISELVNQRIWTCLLKSWWLFKNGLQNQYFNKSFHKENLCYLKKSFSFRALPISVTWLQKQPIFMQYTLIDWFLYGGNMCFKWVKILTVEITNNIDTATTVAVETVCFSIYGFCILWSLQKNPLWKVFSTDSITISPIMKNINATIFRKIVTCFLNTIMKPC